eukprot:4466461-Amphidinium_carterae.1
MIVLDRSAVHDALGGLWHEARTHCAFAVGDLCVLHREEVEDLFQTILSALAVTGIKNAVRSNYRWWTCM